MCNTCFIDGSFSDRATMGIILVAMAALAVLELVVPLQAARAARRAHAGPNLALTLLTFASNVALNGGLVLTLELLHTHRLGLLPALALPASVATAIVVIVLDLAFYACHVAMHHVPGLWRFHRVHHSDPFVDVTTTIRQHPGETVIRSVFTAAFALPLGASPGAFTIYRLCSALSGLLEHANLRAPAGLDRLLALVTTWPHLHKVHHSRAAEETNTNYGNLFSLFDRLFGTFTPSARGRAVTYGLDGLDDPETQSTSGLLALPFRGQRRRFAGAARFGRGANRRSSPSRLS